MSDLSDPPALTPDTTAPTPAPIPDEAAEPRWSRGRMAEFIGELAATQCVASAARSVGMSRQSAYRLRARQANEAFDLAWAIALEQGYDQLYRSALARAVSGTEVPVFQRGEQVGTRRHYDERLTCFLLAHGKQGRAPLPRARHDAIESWTGHLAELIEQVRGGEAEDGGKGETA